VRTDSVEFHEEAIAEYDAAFDWYLEQNPDTALKFDAEVDRALAQILQAPQRWDDWPAFHSKVLAETISFYRALPSTRLRSNPDRGDRPH
jgi:plasmid stabilization system protein ParE